MGYTKNLNCRKPKILTEHTMTETTFRAAGYPWRLYCGRQAIEQDLQQAVDRAGAKRAFIVCSPSVNRRTDTGAPFNDAEAITAAEAVRAYTWGSAYAAKQEHVKGSIAAGKLADFTILSEDPTAVAANRIAGLEVAGTFVDGVLRYSTPGFATR